MRKPRALDLFCCAGGATKGLQLAGFHVTGVDINPQPRYCGDEFHQADALTFPLEGFDFIWASPPCQAFSTLRALQKQKEYPNHIPATRERLVASGTHYAIENVEGAPLGDSGYLIVLCGTMFGLQTPDGRAELRRHRLFETSFSIPLRPRCQHGFVPAIGVTGHSAKSDHGVISVHGDHARDRRRKEVITVTGHTPVEPRRTISVTGSTPQTNVVHNRDRATYSTVEAAAAMGIDWMTMKGLSQAIPPAYSRFVGEQVMRIIRPDSLPKSEQKTG